MMQSSQDKDFIAWQYTHAFSDIFEFAIPRYRVAENKWQDRAKTQSDAWAATAVYLGFLARQLDSHVVRKHGEFLAKELMYEARVIEADYWATDNPKLMQKHLLAWDASLKERNINPGTSADLTVACLLVNYLQ
jgi:triphosphoribosyl-dephospho-CoA synthase